MDSKVQVLDSLFVVPSEPAPRKELWLSSLDLEHVSRGHVTSFHLYRCSDVAVADFFHVPRLKEALAKALAVFYPLAGRLSVGNDVDGRVVISCNDEGALFVVTRADLTVDDIKDMTPSPELRKLVAPFPDPVSVILAVQVTFLKCGGVAVGTAMHHVSVDATSMFHFIQTWSAFSKHGDCPAVELPCHDRTLLRARSPPTVHPDAFLTFYPVAHFCNPLGHLVTKAFIISRDQVDSLKHLCGGTSTFCAISALLWKWMCIVRRLPSDSEARLTFPANARRRIRPHIPNHYFGNAVLRLGVNSAVRDIAMGALASIASRIKGTIDRMDDELVRSAIDYYEMTEMDNGPLRGSLPPTHLHVVSWLGMPLYNADFGWGKPQVMSRGSSIVGGVALLMNDDEGTTDDAGSVRVLMCMEAAAMKELERLYLMMQSSKLTTNEQAD